MKLIRNSICYRGATAWNSLTNKETTAKILKDFKCCLQKFDTDKMNFEPILTWAHEKFPGGINVANRTTQTYSKYFDLQGPKSLK